MEIAHAVDDLILCEAVRDQLAVIRHRNKGTRLCKQCGNGSSNGGQAQATGVGSNGGQGAGGPTATIWSLKRPRPIFHRACVNSTTYTPSASTVPMRASGMSFRAAIPSSIGGLDVMRDRWGGVLRKKTGSMLLTITGRSLCTASWEACGRESSR